FFSSSRFAFRRNSRFRTFSKRPASFIGERRGFNFTKTPHKAAFPSALSALRAYRRQVRSGRAGLSADEFGGALVLERADAFLVIRSPAGCALRARLIVEDFGKPRRFLVDHPDDALRFEERCGRPF